ncbi:hypothetical protein pwc_43 [Weissella phage PWc]|nr:hypothetical protein pwc_43 [Weissella phage PWc]
MVTRVSEEIIVNGVSVGELSSVIGGDTLPVVMTVLSEVLVGYDENGAPVYSSESDNLVEEQRNKFTVKIMKQHELLKSLDL